MTAESDQTARGTSGALAGEVVFRRGMAVLLLIVWASAAVATHLPAKSIPPMYTSDKTKHLIGYFGLAMVFLLTLRAYRIRPRRRWLLAVPILAVYGAVDELTQPWFNRYASLLDWYCNVAGVMLACLSDATLWWCVGRASRRESSA